MSYTERHIGKLIPTGKTIKEYLKGYHKPFRYNTLEEYFYEEFYNGAIELDGQVYKIVEATVDPDHHLLAYKDDQGVIHYDVTYYNGCLGFTEAIEEAIKQNVKEDK